MRNGRFDQNSSRRNRRRNNVLFQEKQNDCGDWLWGAHRQHGCHKSRRHGCGDASDENLPQSNCLERGLLKRGPSRRTHSIRVLETRYPCENRENAAEPQISSPRQSKNNASEQARSFRGNQPLTDSRGAIDKEDGCAKRKCGNNGRLADDSIGCRVFRALGDDLLVKFLTPREVYNIQIAFEWDFDWGRAWHGGKVKNKAVAARIQFDLQQGLQAEQLLAKYNRDFAFSAFWYLVDSVEIERLANKYRHYKTIKKICRFLC